MNAEVEFESLPYCTMYVYHGTIWYHWYVDVYEYENIHLDVQHFIGPTFTRLQHSQKRKNDLKYKHSGN